MRELTGRAQRELVVAYHKVLLDHVRQGSDRLDAAEIDVFELDDLIYHQTASARVLRKCCGYGGKRMDWAVHSLEYMRSSESEPDWWATGRSRDRDD